jgi:Zn-dependent protease with chaperone function
MGTSLSFLLRALVALAFLIGFYAMALGLAGLCIYLPYVEVAHMHRFSLRLTIAMLACAFAILRSLFVARPSAFHAPGPELRAEDQPELFALVREIAARMNTRMPAHVYLVPDVNAFVAEVGGFLGFGTTRVMGIGLGLLAVDDVSQLRATLAHEFGHFTGGDTWLGGLVYRTRASIAQVLSSLGRGVLTKPFEWYGHVYLRVSYAVGRHQELQADRAGIEIAGRDAHVDGLTNETRAGVLFDAFVRSEIAPLCGAGLCPKHLYQGFTTFVQRAPLAEVEAMLASRETDPHDTHPALAARVAFARTVPDPGVARDLRPAMALLQRADDVEIALEPYLFGALGVSGALRRIAWDEVTAAYYAPHLAEEARSKAERLYPVLKAGPKYADVARALLAALRPGASGVSRAALANAVEPRLGELPPGILETAVASVLGRTLGVLVGAALVERGGTWKTDVGAPLSVVVGAESHEPIKRAAEAIETPAGLDALESLVAA